MECSKKKLNKRCVRDRRLIKEIERTEFDVKCSSGIGKEQTCPGPYP
jgi:hypothetical protein